MDQNNLTGLARIAVNNNLGLQATAIVFHGVSSNKLENSVLEYLKSKGIDTSNLGCRVIPKSMCKNNDTLSKIASKTDMPFIVMLFNYLSKDNFTRKSAIEQDAFNDIQAALFNFGDNAQIVLKNNQELNEVLKKLVYRDRFSGEFRWGINKKAKKAYIALNPVTIFMLAFDIAPDNASRYVIDFIDPPMVRTDRNTYMTETIMNIAISLRPPKKKPQHDPISDVR